MLKIICPIKSSVKIALLLFGRRFTHPNWTLTFSVNQNILLQYMSCLYASSSNWPKRQSDWKKPDICSVCTSVYADNSSNLKDFCQQHKARNLYSSSKAISPKNLMDPLDVNQPRIKYVNLSREDSKSAGILSGRMLSKVAATLVCIATRDVHITFSLFSYL